MSAFRARLVPELIVSNLAKSLDFWCNLLGFSVFYDRPHEYFAYLDLDGAQVMLEQSSATERQWITETLEKPYGRGINFQIEIPAIEPALAKLKAANHPLFMEPEEKFYQTGAVETGVRQFLVQDPDGYLIRLSANIGTRSLQNTRTTN